MKCKLLGFSVKVVLCSTVLFHYGYSLGGIVRKYFHLKPVNRYYSIDSTLWSYCMDFDAEDK